MLEIWKYPINDGNSQSEIDVPENHAILTVAYQSGQLCLWVSVDPKSPKIHKLISSVGTGFPYNPTAKFIGTVQQGPFVWHIFDGDIY